jgi:glycosyltransferase involved in cell wall biosynthesis
MPSKKSIALVVPLFNEGKRWDEEYWQILAKASIVLYFVNDGSTDNTGELAKSLSGSTVLSLPNNIGKAEAVRIGMRRAMDENPHLQIVGFLDADGAFDVNEVIDFSTQATALLKNKFDALWSSRVKLAGRDIARNLHRHLLGRLVSSILATSSQELPYDSQSGLKFYSANDSMRKSLEYTSKTRWFFELEHFSAYQEFNHKTLRIWEQPVVTWRDIKGSKLYHLKSIFILREILLIWIMLRKTKHLVNS